VPIPDDAPVRVQYSLEEALDLLSDMELVRETVRGPSCGRYRRRSNPNISVSPVNWACITKKEARMPVEVLSLSEAARRLDIPLRQMVQIVYDRAIRYVMVEGIPHVTKDALDEYRERAS
jgi:riboflavin biosynthesis pyrimidine reductase